MVACKRCKTDIARPIFRDVKTQLLGFIYRMVLIKIGRKMRLNANVKRDFLFKCNVKEPPQIKKFWQEIKVQYILN